MGHIDFYANNAGLQPGCDAPKDYQTVLKLDRNSLKEGQILPDCSHKRAFKYLIETLETPECKFLGIPCHDHEKFMTVRRFVFEGAEIFRLVSSFRVNARVAVAVHLV